MVLSWYILNHSAIAGILKLLVFFAVINNTVMNIFMHNFSPSILYFFGIGFQVWNYFVKNKKRAKYC